VDPTTSPVATLEGRSVIISHDGEVLGSRKGNVMWFIGSSPISSDWCRGSLVSHRLRRELDAGEPKLGFDYISQL
jgi:hypothetical protein